MLTQLPLYIQGETLEPLQSITSEAILNLSLSTMYYKERERERERERETLMEYIAFPTPAKTCSSVLELFSIFLNCFRTMPIMISRNFFHEL